MFGIGKAFEERVRRAENGESNLGTVDERSEAVVMALSGFAEENGLDAAAGAQRFFDQTDAFDADET
jgi:hypothetical protein